MKSFVVKICLVLVMIFGATAPASSGSNVVELEGMNRFQMGKNFTTNLTNYEGENVTLYMKSGIKFMGKLKSVNMGMILLKRESSGVEFMDALIKLEDVSSFSVIVRGYKK